MKPSTAPAATAKPAAGPSFKIQSSSTKTRYLKVVIYAEHGVGKTYLAGTSAEVPEMNDVLLIAAESGELTLETEEKHNFTNIDTIRVENYKQISDVYDFLKLHCTFRDKTDEASVQKLKELQAKYFGMPIEDITETGEFRLRRYRTAIVDSVSEVDSYCVNQVIGVNSSTKLDDEGEKMEWPEYGKVNNMMRRFVRNFRDLPMHIIMTAARASKEDDAKRERFMPALTGKFSTQIQGFVDLVGYYVANPPDDKGVINRRLYVQPQGKFNAKCRFSNYKGTHFVNPTIKGILTAVGLTKPAVGN